MYKKVEIVSLGKTNMDKVDVMEKFLKDTRDECNIAFMELDETERALAHADLAGPLARLLAKKVADDRFSWKARKLRSTWIDRAWPVRTDHNRH